jgi:hypothetical protein
MRLNGEIFFLSFFSQQKHHLSLSLSLSLSLLLLSYQKEKEKKLRKNWFEISFLIFISF